MKYLELKDAKCKDCYKCLRECPAKAIEYVNQKAQIIPERCILCGNCTLVCPQNAKFVHSESESVLELLKSQKVIASVAPSFVSSFSCDSFAKFKIALKKIGFFDAEETAVGAHAVTEKYSELLKTDEYENFITSACPAVNTMIELYFPKALQYLARVDSPMLAHAKIIKKATPDACVVFIGPCIAKKKEAFDSQIIEGVLTFEDLDKIFKANNIDLNSIEVDEKDGEFKNKARFYPISRGIIKSFDNKYADKYEFLAVDGVHKCMEVLANIENYHGMFLELNACEYACVNGPCALTPTGRALEANAEIRHYVGKTAIDAKPLQTPQVDITRIYPRRESGSRDVSEFEIQKILNRTGKFVKDDELDCGACGYSTCREKAWAVANGYAEIDMCLPYMRKRAESMSYEIIRNSPNGIAVIDYEFKVQDMNARAKEFWGVTETDVAGKDLVQFCDPTPFITAVSTNQNLIKNKIKIDKTNKFVEMSVNLIREHKIMFCIIRDITNSVQANEEFLKMKLETIQTTDDVIKKQMRVAQEIASLLGETTAESKVALLKLKKTLAETDGEED
ncbi:MAG: [Fe-Fe] hydrogenase large subunit C-terminal domain-containing protein [Clostridia bacterium]